MLHDVSEFQMTMALIAAVGATTLAAGALTASRVLR